MSTQGGTVYTIIFHVMRYQMKLDHFKMKGKTFEAMYGNVICACYSDEWVFET